MPRSERRRRPAGRHPVVARRNSHGSIPVPLVDSPELFWVRRERLQPTCRAAGVEYAEGLEGWEKSGKFNHPVLTGVVVARLDAGRLAEALARSRRAEAATDAAAVVLELAWECLPGPLRLVRSVGAAVARPVRVAAWADALDGEHPDLAALLRRYACPGYQRAATAEERDIRALQAAAVTPAMHALAARIAASAVDPDVLSRAKELLESRGREMTGREVDAVFRRHIDDTHD